MEEAPKIREQIIAELSELKGKFYDSPELYEKLVEFGQGLRKRYSDAESYELFHFLIGSSYDKEDVPNFDFTGDDSIEKFLRETE